MNKPWNISAALLAAALGGCAGGGNWQGGGGGPLYRCEHGIEFRVKFIDDTAVLDGPGGHDILNRDAGGQGPQQTVYSNPRMRAEFGLGASGREARLHYPMLPLSARCVRD
ncbi:hypothetical protein SAMN05216350_11334 [Polaromonas sp. YR568]|uniref:hypothetical protein n=1 Tax=Polaromonas sp. YR568 TaxID=1855301 RepID=UPI0008EF80D6|nr:hypothetical protein [Polaromonas sp. YR568]SFV01583.1 hypothetical protein SAMN05216350_11334 [Polaromonas sp. YR568]